MAIITIQEAKDFLRMDDDSEDVLIESLITGAELYLYNATGKNFDSTNPLAKLYCRVLVTDWYENRGLMQDKNVSEKVRFTLSSIMLQLQYSK
ncbi:phage gp6-like head-tail connector protein [Clostridium saccharobutylicum]|uniref:head-tail connector protein n=1 Tax=Clostridium saccharobutylicum TaxID=169679 RepID=UPI000983F914|nr:head-tail connector protein [Clostridium saccharobutylicum]AQS09680.1 phage gp6-like head-tail connector protein [Clostridium saccharobutylicum]MBC2436925.1 phage gp6-like head-tail connector protein [Clostridium saccharobutylicum]NSB89276.1 putative phage protein (predicted DNA packaging) [Clostridium saccharobutylicum]NYC27930.1 putative phage protein (predicted DNA packaging) [Clostridium saccharobutylicum]OOM17125.1 phage gp6-like head-tail connector protein [Clostridium saccharobutylic